MASQARELSTVRIRYSLKHLRSQSRDLATFTLTNRICFAWHSAVGDNPYADIAGANGYGWNSVLVKTGVYMPKGFENHHVHPATAVVDHVEDAVRWIIAKEQMKKQR